MDNQTYRPQAWHWTIAGNHSIAWSSAAAAYVVSYPSNAVFDVASEADVVDTLNRAGYPHLAPGYDYKSAVKAQIDATAEAHRLRHITGGPSKSLEYTIAAIQAFAVRNLGEAATNALSNHGVAEFPVLAASVPGEAPTLHDAALLVIARFADYAHIIGRIKRTVIDAKAIVDAAADAPSAWAVYASIEWPTP